MKETDSRQRLCDKLLGTEYRISSKSGSPDEVGIYFIDPTSLEFSII